jgi:hypothetical protein
MLCFFPEFGLGPVILALIISAALGLPPYVGVPNTVLALLLASMASSVWQNTSTATAALQIEATALSRLGIIAATSPALASELKGDLSSYIQLVEQGECGKEYTMRRAPEIDQTLSNLYSHAWTIDAGAVHRANRHTAITAIVLWCLCTALVFSMIKLQIHPYKGFNPLTPDFTSLS